MRFAALLLTLSMPLFGGESKLWSDGGENWDPAGRLPDFSFAGYGCGEHAIPEVPDAVNVRELGAVGDGVHDDSEAFLKAIKAVSDLGKPGAIRIPAGRYKITRILEVTKPGIVFRGDGPDQSVIFCPTPLEKIRSNMGKTTGGRATSNYSWSGGFIWFKGSERGKALGEPTASVPRGSRRIPVDATRFGGVNAGDWIQIDLKDDSERSLLSHLYSGDPGDVSKIAPGSHRTSFVSRVASVDEGVLTLERHLRTDLRPEWSPRISTFEPSVRDCGVEDLSFAFPPRSYKGHFTELGYNGIALSNVSDCWVRGVRFLNADSGIFVSGRFCTMSDLQFGLSEESKTQGGNFGHHGVSMTGDDNLLTRFNFQQRFIHDITVARGAGNVASKGRGTDLCFDHHERAPYENLFTDLDVGAGTRVWHSGGGAKLGRHCGARGTFWNLRSERPVPAPGSFGPASMNLVGVPVKGDPVTDANGRWIEIFAPGELDPSDLHAAQMERRLAAE
ncbi:pectinlyase [Haloferula helveola]|uniref:Pectinlyase n=1 Tax=Haloferula helveola TaxID=490095 RepID=A0ABN6H2D0_9BACT|nr:pectinlyase [Haloferula helveola]